MGVSQKKFVSRQHYAGYRKMLEPATADQLPASYAKLESTQHRI